MPRLYTAQIKGGVPPAGGQDLLELLGSSGKLIKFKRLKISATDVTIPTSQMVQIEIGGGLTALGTGTAVTPAKTDTGDAAASFTATSLTTVVGAGTAAPIIEDGFHVYNGYDEGSIDPAFPGLCYAIGAEALYVRLVNSVSGTVHLSITAWVEETSS